MRKLLFILTLLASMLCAENACAWSQSELEFNKNYNFLVTPSGEGIYHCKMLVYTGSAGGNAWCEDGRVCAIAGSDTIAACVFKGDNYSNQRSGSVSTTVQALDVDKNGDVRVDGHYLSSNQSASVNSSYSYAGSYNAVFIEFDWVAPSRFIGKNITFGVYSKVQKFTTGPYYYTINNLATYAYNTHLRAPVLVTPYVKNDAPAANAGAVNVYYTSTDSIKQLDIYIDGLKRDSIMGAGTYGVITLPQCDSIRALQVKAHIQLVGEQKVVMPSATIAVKPYHSINSISVKELREGGVAATPITYKGYNVVEWDINYPLHEDILSSDAFIIKRSNSSDMSDATQVGTISLNDSVSGQPGHYRFVDTSEGALYNTSNSDLLLYYTVERITASNFWSDGTPELFCKKDSVNKFPWIPEHYNIHVEKDKKDWDTSRKLNITIDIVNETFANNYAYYRTKWYDDVEVYLTRKDLTSGSTRTLERKLKNSEITFNDSTRTYEMKISDNMLWPYCESLAYDLKVVPPSSIKQKTTYLRWTEPTSKEYYYENAAAVTSFKASYGTEVGHIKLQWVVSDGNKDSIRITRKETNATDSITLKVNSLQGYYIDNDVKPGKSYKYTITAYYYFNGKTYISTGADIGQMAPYGIITGRIVGANGTALPRQKVKCTSDSGNYQETTTATDGTYQFEASFGHKYQISPDATQLTFEYLGQSPAIANIDFTGEKPVAEQKDINFTCTSMYRFSGYVYYENSTVPVRNAYFTVNNDTVFSQNGEILLTDAEGAFNFYIPRQTVNVRVNKDGHTFAAQGYYAQDGQRDFTPLKAIDNVKFYDQTKVHLIGRIAGGDVQGQLPLGLSLSQNNLGDSLKIVLMLEGDNTASMVYFPEETNRTTYNVTVPHPYDDKSKNKTSTTVTMERKRIIIRPDIHTGEFCADIFPTKYKVTEISAEGYGSLLTVGAGEMVIDLSDSIRSHTSENSELSTEYNARFTHTYHSGVNISYQQRRYGAPTAFFGEQTMDYTNLANQTVQLVTAYNTGTKKSDGTDKWAYTLNSPVYKNGVTYGITASAHEDYYYNNLQLNRHDQVPMTGKTIVIHNGFTSSKDTLQRVTDANGAFEFDFTASNTTFALTGEDALRQLNMSVEVNGSRYQAETLEAFVTGQRVRGTDAVVDTIADISVFDVLRDPMGYGSYSYMESGKQYDLSHKYTMTWNVGLKIGLQYGVEYKVITGTSIPNINAVLTEGSSKTGTTLPINLYSGNYNNSGSYNITFNDRITTSSDPSDQGAMADVYIGATTAVQYDRTDVITPIDSLSYTYIEPSITTGQAKLIAKGQAPDGHTVYLVRSEGINASVSYPATFVLSQKYILKTLMPNIVAKRNTLLTGGSKEEAQKLANTSEKTVYWTERSTDDGDYGFNDYTPLFPHGTRPVNFIDEVYNYNSQLVKWINIIAANEKNKIDAINRNDPYATYKVSSGNKIEHSESVKYYHSTLTNWNILNGIGGTNNGWNGAALANLGSSAATQILNSILSYKKSTSLSSDSYLASFIKAMKNLDETKVKSSAFTFTLEPDLDFTFNNQLTQYIYSTAGSGYVISTSNDSYQDISVFRAVADSLPGLASMKDAMQYSYNGVGVNDSLLIHDYIFVTKAGATRYPYIQPDSTMFYMSGTPLSARTLKIDNPTITIDKPERSGLPEDGKAVYTIHLANESELDENVTGSLSKTSDFLLCLDETSNPNGAKVSIDGMPLTDGRTITIAPGKSITKTMELERGTAFDYEQLALVFRVKEDKYNTSRATFSAHFIPSACPVAISSPTDKWVMNTNSPYDSKGYYIPVSITGFDINYDNFHHLEFQYKKSTESDADWVNLCSYFPTNNDDYEKASGTKALIEEDGRINDVRFYGATNIEEMKYDLRAVTFCTYGTGFTSKASSVISGTKDTRRPEIFGKAKPTNGILTFEDEIILPFTEPIAYNYLNHTTNFQVQGYKNYTSINDSCAIVFPGTDTQYAITEVGRSLDNRDFSFDVMVQPFDDLKEMTVFSHYDEEADTYINFGITDKRQLFADIDGLRTYSTAIKETLTQQFKHIGMVYSNTTKTIKFFYGDNFLSNDPALSADDSSEYDGESGLIGLGLDVRGEGKPFHGRMIEARLWNRCLTQEQIARINGKTVVGYLDRLVARWPLNQSFGNTAEDVVGGATLQLNETSWQRHSGFSLPLNRLRANVSKPQYFTRSAEEDFTVSYWFQATEGKGIVFGSDSGTIFGQITDDDFTIRTDTANVIAITEASVIADGNWHHFALTVNHSQNTAVAYIDSKAVMQQDATAFAGVSGSDLHFGDTSLNMRIDNFQLWNLALPENYIAQNYASVPTGQEMGLQVFMPFERTVNNANGVPEQRFSMRNEVVSTKIPNDTLITAAIDVSKITSDIAAPLKQQDVISNLNFSWSSTDTDLQINLDMEDREINKRNIFITVSGVEDVNGNAMKSPKMWTVYVNRNVLKWTQQTYTVNLQYAHGDTISVNWRNLCGESINYNINSSSDNITVDNTMGTAEPDHEYSANVYISNALSPGTYTEQLYLVDNKNSLVEPLTLVINVKAQAPDWTPTRKDGSMTLMAQAMKRGKVETIDTETNDLVAAFINNECVGVANITNTSGQYYAYLNINGDTEDNGATVQFFLWDSTTGKTYEMTPDRSVTFQNQSVVGCPPESPVVLHQSDNIIQNITLKKGWNWIAFTQVPDEEKGIDVFLNNNVFALNDIIKTDAQQAKYVNSDAARWDGDLVSEPVSPLKIYRVKSANGGSTTVLGRSLTGSEQRIPVKAGWNELPYTLTDDLPIAKALTSFTLTTGASEGDMVMSLDQFAVLSSQHGWIGSLQTMRPGTGYYLRHTGNDCAIDFSKVVTETSASARRNASALSKASAITAESESSMPVIAAFAEGSQLAGLNTTLYAVSGTDIVGEATPVTTPDGQQLFFINVNANTGERVQLAVPTATLTSDDADESLTAVATVTAIAKTQLGTLKAPYIIGADTANGSLDGQLYTIDGIQMSHATKSGIYLQTTDNGTKKITRK